jgi:hypothetical protein
MQMTVDLFRKTINHALLAEGMAYPMVYTDNEGHVDLDLMREVVNVTAEARRLKKGVWESDLTLAGAVILSKHDLENNIVFYPKLFRRLINYANEGGDLGRPRGFINYLKKNPDPLLFFSAEVLAGQGEPQKKFLHDVLEVETRADGKDYLKLKVPPEFLVFEPLHQGGQRGR